MYLRPELLADLATRYPGFRPDDLEELSRQARFRLSSSLRHDPGRDAALADWTRLVAEAVARGYLTRCEGQPPRHEALIRWLFLDHLPETLVELEPRDRSLTLALAWNLSEGSRVFPAWMRPWLFELRNELLPIHDLATTLPRVLARLCGAGEAREWRWPARTVILDPRPLDPAFLPGTMHLAAPGVVCVHGRIEARSTVNLVFEPEGASRLVRGTHCPETPAPDCSGKVREDRGHFSIDQVQVDLPGLAHAHAWLVSSLGYAVWSAVDSQRLWVVESA